MRCSGSSATARPVPQASQRPTACARSAAANATPAHARATNDSAAFAVGGSQRVTRQPSASSSTCSGDVEPDTGSPAVNAQPPPCTRLSTKRQTM